MAKATIKAYKQVCSVLTPEESNYLRKLLQKDITECEENESLRSAIFEALPVPSNLEF